ncbi:hypothetical protein CMI46_00375 [Candidatus Pacearchaeota archaeon]|nr:hypothetical protein [Candidatus Pacearchaeota archaeon]|tara:strand:+ start:27996 stop:28568 length:573 start_codon:yes stop_codon:yes gene_type:complete
MGKVIWLVISLIVLIIVLGVVVSFFFLFDDDVDENSHIGIPQEISSFCDQNEGDAERDLCYAFQLVENYDYDYECEDVYSTSTFLESCMSEIPFRNAMKSGNPDNCEELTSSQKGAPDGFTYRNKCYIEFAKQKEDLSICEKIGDSTPENRNYKDYCYILLVQLLNDPTGCDLVVNQSLKSDCGQLGLLV